jgi:hypothetical protein
MGGIYSNLTNRLRLTAIHFLYVLWNGRLQKLQLFPHTNEGEEKFR